MKAVAPSQLKKELDPFEKRVTILWLLKGATFGALVGAGGALIWAILDWFAVSYTTHSKLSLTIGGGILFGVLIAVFTKPSSTQIWKSVDRRARLKDRLTTISEGAGGEYELELVEDAKSQFAKLLPKEVFPFRPNASHGATFMLAASAFGVFALSDYPLFLPKEKLIAQSEMKKEAARLEQLKRDIFEDRKQDIPDTKDVQRLQKDLEKLKKDLERARIDPKEAALKKEELARKADELKKEQAKSALDKLDKGESIMDKMLKQRLDEASLQNANMDDLKSSQESFDSKMSEAKKNLETQKNKSKALEQKIADLKKRLESNKLSEAEKKEIEKSLKQTMAEKKEADKALQEAMKQMSQMKLSEEARKTLEKLMNDPKFKELQKLAEKMREQAQNQMSGSGKQPTKEELEEMKRQFEQLMKELQDDEKMKEFLQQLEQALKDMKMGEGMGVLGMGLGLFPGMTPSLGAPGPGMDEDVMTFDAGKNNHQKAVQGKGQGKATFAPSERNDKQKGPEMTFEIKAPTFKGSKSSIPYQKALPAYSSKAEAALNKNEIPKKHQQKVKKYFESLKK
jgi:chemotaxis protein histidine kinase CheA